VDASDDPVRMYLTQMGEIPLLTRQEEITLAKDIEDTRRAFRTHLLECDYVMKVAFKTLVRVHHGELPFDRTVQVSVTARLSLAFSASVLNSGSPGALHLLAEIALLGGTPFFYAEAPRPQS
jgi:hypothetical protein